MRGRICRLGSLAVQVPLLLIADYANVAADGGKLNVMGIFSRIFAEEFPARHPQMYLVAILRASPAEQNTTRKLTIKILDQDGRTEVMSMSGDITVGNSIAGGPVDSNVILRLTDLVFPTPGTYQVAVLVDQDEKETRRIEVVKTTPQA
jgi:hypothetical protein